MNNYIDSKIYGVPAPLKKGNNTSPTKKRVGMEYIHKVYTGDGTYKYYKVHIKRQNKSKIKYFKKLKDAKMFVAFLRENKYL
jgi:hypothetical protein